jgi:predicted CoA-binding protein
MKTSKSERVVIVGASDKPDRYAHRAQVMLKEYGHEVIPVHPRLTQIDGVPVVADLSQVAGPIDTVTMYVGAKISADMTDKLIALKPRRVIFNPGAENPELAASLSAAGIEPQETCTLVILRTGEF